MSQNSWKKEERYFSFNRFLKEKFPFKVYKIPIHAGFTCPNLDGKVASGGCVYCANESFSPNARSKFIPINEQVENGKAFLKKRYRAEKFIAYFQSYSNTYGSINILKEKYDQALNSEDIIGISIGTRPDCVSDEVLDLISGYSKKYHTWLELGLQSRHNNTLERINRGHLYEECEDAVRRAKRLGLLVCLHVILGLPGESAEDMMETADAVAALGADGIKIHHLYVAKNTALAEEYFNGNVKTLSIEEYVPLVADFLERIPSETAVQRLMGDTHGKFLISPVWTTSKAKILELISRELEKRNSFQGVKCQTLPDESLITSQSSKIF